TEDVQPAGLVGRADIDQLVEPAGPEKRRIDQPGAVGRADHDDRVELLHAVHLGQDGVDHPGGDLRLVGLAAARRNQAVDLVDEDDAGRDLPRTGEQAADLL